MMYSIRKTCRKAIVFWLLVLSVGGRSLIAPGFMLDTSGADPLDLRITICGGLNGINSIDGLGSVEHQHHGQPSVPGDSGNSKNHYDHEADHFTAACGLWSASSTFTYNFLLYDVQPDITEIESYAINHLQPYLRDTFLSRHLSRAPPFNYS